MNIHREYLLAAIPEAVRVFGVLLRPFSIGHHLILTRFNSPVVFGGPTSVDDMLLAVWVCGRDYETAIRLLATGQAWRELARWKRSLLRRQWWGLRPNAAGRLADKVKLFAEYLESAQSTPHLFVDEGGKPIGSPSIQALKVRLMKDLHLSESDVLNRPLSLCWWDYATLIELDNRGKIYDRDEYAEAKRKADVWAEKFLAERKQ